MNGAVSSVKAVQHDTQLDVHANQVFPLADLDGQACTRRNGLGRFQSPGVVHSPAPGCAHQEGLDSKAVVAANEEVHGGSFRSDGR